MQNQISFCDIDWKYTQDLRCDDILKEKKSNSFPQSTICVLAENGNLSPENVVRYTPTSLGKPRPIRLSSRGNA